MPLPPSFPLRLRSARTLSPSVRELIFERPDGPLPFEAGQWIRLALPVGPEPGQVLHRSYSIASAPDPGSNLLELAVTRVEGGPGSAVLHAMSPGDELHAMGPQGFFTRPAGVPSLFIGTGTGVTPLRSMLRSALAAGATEPMTLLLGVRHEADILYRDEFAELARRHPNFSVHTTLSRPEPSWQGLSGYVQNHVPALWASLTERSDGTPPHIFLCGLDRMVKAVRDLTRKQMGLSREQIHSERFD